MCGIGGVVLREGEMASPELLGRMAAKLAHRGPDAQGVFVHRNLGAAHRRLKIIDLSPAADQPIFNEDGKIGVVFNGEIYNFRELREELERQGHRFGTRSDTEVIVHAYEEWGSEAFRRLNGIFAIGLWDLRGGAPVLYLARDRAGAKPLFLSARDGRLAFASELKPLLECSWIRREVDQGALYWFLKHSHYPHPLSVLREVRQLEPGAWLRFEGGETIEKRFWDPLELSAEAAGNPRDQETRPEAAWLNELEQVLSRCVSRQLVSDVPLGCFLSGGIDSSLLVMAAQRARRETGKPPLKTFSIGYREKPFDETGYARSVARAFGTEHRELVARPSDLHELIPDIPLYFDQPLADPTLLSTLLLCRFARQEVTVSLSGDGGDELFFGYEFQKLLLRLRPLLRAPARPRAGAFRVLEQLLDWISGPFAAGFSGGARLQQLAKLASILQFRDEEQLFQYFVGTVGPLRMDRLAGLMADPSGMSDSPYRRMREELRGLSWRERIIQLFFRNFLPDTVLAKTDRASMAYGLEARVPWLDNEMMEFSARLPFQYKLRAGTQKYLLRELLRKTMSDVDTPEASGLISGRRKQGFSIPLREWLRGDLKYLLDEYLSVPRLRREGLFAPGPVHELVRAHLERRANHSHLLWSLVSFQLWKERYLP